MSRYIYDRVSTPFGMDDSARRPLDVLEAAVGNEVAVQLKDGQLREGVLTGYDQHMNLVVELPGEKEDTTVIRGDNVVTIGL